MYAYYINGDYIDEEIFFSYEFLFDNQIVTYRYSKDSKRKLLNEELQFNEEVIFKYNYKTGKFSNDISEAKHINLTQRNTEVSALKFIFNNTLYWPDHSPLRLLPLFAICFGLEASDGMSSWDKILTEISMSLSLKMNC